MKASKGEIILFSCGEYSDYSTILIGKVLKDFDPREVRDAYFDEFPDQNQGYRGDNNQFAHYFIKNGYIEEVEYREMHTGYYGSIQVDL